MSYTLGAQAVNASPGSAAADHTATLALSAGDLAVVLISCRDDNTGAISVVGDVNGAYTRCGAIQGSGAIVSAAEVWRFENSAAGTETVTVHFGGSVRASVNLSRFPGGPTSSVLDQNNGNTNGAGTSHSHGSITTTGAALIVTALAGSADVVTGSTQTGFTALTNGIGSGYDRAYFGYRIVTSSTTDTGTVTTGGSAESVGKIVSFNDTSSSPVLTAWLRA